MKHSKRKDFLQHVGAGGFAGLCATMCTHPLDLLQTRLQSTRSLKNVEVVRNSLFFTKSFQGLKSIVQYEGWKGLFRGILPSLGAIVPGRAIFFGFYGFTRERIVNSGLLKEKNPLTDMISSSVGMLATTLAMNPIFLLKTRIQVQENLLRGNSSLKGTQYKGYMDCIKQVYQKEGFFAFYRGITASWLGISETALYFVIYEKFKRHFKINEKIKSNERFPAHWIIGVTIVCKMIASVATYPHELIRTRMRERAMTEHPKLIQITRQIFQEEGFMAFYGGMGIHLIRVIPNAIIVFLVYEFLKSKYISR